MEIRGIVDLLPFLNFLYDRGCRYDLLHSHPDSVKATVHLAENKIEVDFFDDHVDFSCFDGLSQRQVDTADLIKLIEERGR